MYVHVCTHQRWIGDDDWWPFEFYENYVKFIRIELEIN